jgi:sulfur carrier protein ThiS
MIDTPEQDVNKLQKLADLIAKLNIKVRGTVVTGAGDYEIETYYDEVVVEDGDSQEVVRAGIDEHV